MTFRRPGHVDVNDAAPQEAWIWISARRVVHVVFFEGETTVSAPTDALHLHLSHDGSFNAWRPA